MLRDSPFYYRVPTHWGVSDSHSNDIMNFIEKYYEKLQRFKSDKIITRLLLEVGKRLSTITMFMENIPIRTEIVKDVDGTRQTFHNIFDKIQLIITPL